jgi:hypothetical protein
MLFFFVLLARTQAMSPLPNAKEAGTLRLVAGYVSTKKEIQLW